MPDDSRPYTRDELLELGFKTVMVGGLAYLVVKELGKKKLIPLSQAMNFLPKK